MCEKPLGLNAGEVREMYHAARDAGVVHMTAFTYRFAPAMRYLKHLVASGALGEPRHFRSQRFLGLARDELGLAAVPGPGRRGRPVRHDDPSHRLRDRPAGPARARERRGGAVRSARTDNQDGEACPPSDVDDWSSIIGEFASGATGVWEGTTLAKGYGRGGFGHEWAEINGSEGSAVYQLHAPNTILVGKTGQDLAPVEVPREFLKPADSPRDPGQGEPATVFRYDLVWEFVSAIVEQRAGRAEFLRRTASPDRGRRRDRIVRRAALDRDRRRVSLKVPAPVDSRVRSEFNVKECVMAGSSKRRGSSLRAFVDGRAGLWARAATRPIRSSPTRIWHLWASIPSGSCSAPAFASGATLRPRWPPAIWPSRPARRCLEQAGVSPDEVDLLVLGTFTPDVPVASTAAMVQDRLGLPAAAIEISAACAGFVYCAGDRRAVRRHRRQPVRHWSSAPIATRGSSTPATQRSIRSSATAPARCCWRRLARAGLAGLRAGGRRIGGRDALQGDGRLARARLARGHRRRTCICCGWTARRVQMGRLRAVRFDRRSAGHAQLELADIDLFVLHQANLRIIEAAADIPGASTAPSSSSTSTATATPRPAACRWRSMKPASKAASHRGEPRSDERLRRRPVLGHRHLSVVIALVHAIPRFRTRASVPQRRSPTGKAAPIISVSLSNQRNSRFKHR